MSQSIKRLWPTLALVISACATDGKPPTDETEFMPWDADGTPTAPSEWQTVPEGTQKDHDDFDSHNYRPFPIEQPPALVNCELLKKQERRDIRANRDIGEPVSCLQPISFNDAGAAEDFNENSKPEIGFYDVNHYFILPLEMLSRALQQEINTDVDTVEQTSAVTDAQVSVVQERMRKLLREHDLDIEGLSVEDVPTSGTMDKETAQAIIKFAFAFDYNEAFINERNKNDFEGIDLHRSLAYELKYFAPETYKQYSSIKIEEWMSEQKEQREKRRSLREKEAEKDSIDIDCKSTPFTNHADRNLCGIEIKYEGHTFNLGTLRL